MVSADVMWISPFTAVTGTAVVITAVLVAAAVFITGKILKKIKKNREEKADEEKNAE